MTWQGWVYGLWFSQMVKQHSFLSEGSGCNSWVVFSDTQQAAFFMTLILTSLTGWQQPPSAPKTTENYSHNMSAVCHSPFWLHLKQFWSKILRGLSDICHIVSRMMCGVGIEYRAHPSCVHPSLNQQNKLFNRVFNTKSMLSEEKLVSRVFPALQDQNIIIQETPLVSVMVN